jgi:hypothetical protein
LQIADCRLRIKGDGRAIRNGQSCDHADKRRTSRLSARRPREKRSAVATVGPSICNPQWTRERPRPGQHPAGDGFAGIAQVTQKWRTASPAFARRPRENAKRPMAPYLLRETADSTVVQVFSSPELRRLVEPAQTRPGQVKLRRRFQDDSPSILPRASREHINSFNRFRDQRGSQLVGRLLPLDRIPTMTAM